MRTFKDYFTEKRYFNKYIRLGDWAGCVVSKCGCSSLLATAKDLQGDETAPLSCEEWQHLHFAMADISSGKYKTFAIIRHPLMRIESAYNTLKYIEADEEKWLKLLVREMRETSGKDLNRHVISQFAHYKEEDIDVFVPIELLSDFMRNEMGLACIRRNTSTNKPTFRLEDFEGLLDEDIATYERIMKSDKIYRP